MPQSAEGYLARAEECVRLANLTRDSMIQRRLLELRQSYLKIAENLNKPMSMKGTNRGARSLHARNLAGLDWGQTLSSWRKR